MVFRLFHVDGLKERYLISCGCRVKRLESDQAMPQFFLTLKKSRMTGVE